MKYILLILVFLNVTEAFAQDQEIIVPTQQEKRLFVGVNFSTDYAFSTIGIKDPIATSFFNSTNKSLRGKLGFTSGFNIKYQLTKKLAFETGVQYSNKGYVKDYSGLENLIDDRRGFNYIIKTTAKETYLDIPARIIYRTGKQKIKFIASTGIITNFRLKATRINSFSKVSDTRSKLDNINPRNFSATVSLGIDFQYSKDLSFTIEPTYRHGLHQTEFHPWFKTYLHNAGLNIGCYYAIK